LLATKYFSDPNLSLPSVRGGEVEFDLVGLVTAIEAKQNGSKYTVTLADGSQASILLNHDV
jgi:hypothetical protein